MAVDDTLYQCFDLGTLRHVDWRKFGSAAGGTDFCDDCLAFALSSSGYDHGGPVLGQG